MGPANCGIYTQCNINYILCVYHVCWKFHATCAPVLVLLFMCGWSDGGSVERQTFEIEKYALTHAQIGWFYARLRAGANHAPKLINFCRCGIRGFYHCQAINVTAVSVCVRNSRCSLSQNAL